MYKVFLALADELEVRELASFEQAVLVSTKHAAE